MGVLPPLACNWGAKVGLRIFLPCPPPQTMLASPGLPTSPPGGGTWWWCQGWDLTSCERMSGLSLFCGQCYQSLSQESRAPCKN